MQALQAMRDDVSVAQARNFLVTLYEYVGELTYKVGCAERALTDTNPEGDTQPDHQTIAEWRAHMDAAHEVISQLRREYPDTHTPTWTIHEEPHQQSVCTFSELRQSRRRAGR
ncbi:Uncharacterised protein [Mycobacteroides abscessus subsp. massiliense]|nr:Uncharacterised protein [Mycobacteroides abscessus subsp. massiliense]SLC84448.1 Uncharacterised protein [Mycobacteroides abscessus subsp. massiliense]